MHFSKTIRLFACISSAAAALLGAGSALARPEVPGQLYEAAGMQCVPLCTMCHATNPGQADNWPSLLGGIVYADVKAEKDIKAAYQAWATNPATDPRLVEGVKRGYKPDTLDGMHTPLNVCGPVYGCAVPAVKHVTGSRDYVGVLWMGGAMIVGGLLRRRKRAR
jgi:hypothetical protein